MRSIGAMRAAGGRRLKTVRKFKIRLVPEDHAIVHDFSFARAAVEEDDRLDYLTRQFVSYKKDLDKMLPLVKSRALPGPMTGQAPESASTTGYALPISM
jgi:hypothetical protein